MRKLAVTLSIIMALPMSLGPIPANASVSVKICDPSATNWGGGTGTSSDPYLVCSRSHLENLGSATTGQHVKLARSIDLGGSSSPWAPITTFNGVFDGNFNTISGMYVNGDLERYGFIGDLAIDAEIRNLIFTAPEISSQYDGSTASKPEAGILAAHANDETFAENIYISNPVISGQLSRAGFLYGATVNSPQTATISHVHIIGGELDATAPTSDKVYYAGVVGYGPADIHRLSVSGNMKINGAEGDFGGLLGFNISATSDISQVVAGVSITDADGSANNASAFGGAIGWRAGGAVKFEDILVTGSFTAKSFSSGGRIGGLAGLHYWGEGQNRPDNVLITGSFDDGSASRSNQKPIDGGVLPSTVPDDSDLLYDKTINSLFSEGDFGNGKTTVELQTRDTYSNAGFSIVPEVPSGWSLDDAADPIWKITEGSYPEQIWVDVSAARFNTNDVVETVDLYVYPDEHEVIDLSSLEADDGVIIVENLDSALLQMVNVDFNTDKRVELISTPSTPESLITSFDAEFNKAGVTQKVTFNVNVSDEDLSPLTTVLPTDVTATVGDTIWASAYERYLDTSVLVDGMEANRVEEYVYRITTEENVDSDTGTSVDLQSLEGYDFLDQDDQKQWYEDTGHGADGVDYEFYWYAFACVGSDEFDLQPATNLRTEYVSLEEMVTNSGLDRELNADLRHLVDTWDPDFDSQQTVVGVDNASNIVGSWGSNGAPISSLEIVADCPTEYDLKALQIVSEGEYAIEKSLAVEESITLESLDSSTDFETDPVGLTFGVTGGGGINYDQALWGLTTIAAAPNSGGFSSPSPFQGPVITDVGGDSEISGFNAAPGESASVQGSNLNSVSSVTVGGVEAEIISTDDSRVVFTVPETLEPGSYDLVVVSGGQSVRVQEQIVITSSGVQAAAGCEGQQPNLWTKRISETEAKVYIKCGTPGVSYRIDVQQNSGDYETLITRTLVDENDDRQVFNSVGRYIVRTIDLESKTRIRIFADDEKQWQVVYNQR